MSFCCALPLPTGTGNIASSPQLLSDRLHLSETSPCIGAGTNLATGSDIDGQPWASPPSIGCVEWRPAPLMVAKPMAQASSTPPNLNVSIALPAGQTPFSYSWLKDGALLEDDGVRYSFTRTTNMMLSHFGLADAGGYQVIASNAFGMSTSAVLQVVVHCVDAAGSSPTPPFSDWLTAATNIQDAIDAAGPAEFVLVTNGLYSSGGRAMAGDLTNRVALTKSVTVISLSGPETTTIRGSIDPASINGPLATRCAWMDPGTRLEGFTLTGGATRDSGDLYLMQCGGGVVAGDALIVNCIIATNFANYGGGGSYGGTFVRCRIIGNSAGQYGGGEHSSALYACYLSGNSAGTGGGGYSGKVFNCTIVGNSAAFGGGGLASADPLNCIIYYNSIGGSYDLPSANYKNGLLDNCCTIPLPSSGTNITSEPQLLDNWHLATTSPCRGAGTLTDPRWPFHQKTVAMPEDLDGESWATPPPIGCDEVWEAGITGPISVRLLAGMPAVVVNHMDYFTASINGRASRLGWDFGDGVSITNQSLLGMGHSWTNPGDYTVTFTAFNTDHPEGVATNITISVVPLLLPELSSASFSGTNFTASFGSQAGVYYYLEGTTNISPPTQWQTLLYKIGDGTSMQVTDVLATNEVRFYRLRVQ